MPPVPAVRGSRVVGALEKAGFVVGRINGSHHIMRHPDGRRYVRQRRSRPDRVAYASTARGSPADCRREQLPDDAVVGKQVATR